MFDRGRAGRPAVVSRVDCLNVDCTPDGAFTGSTGGAISVVHTGLGQYLLTLGGVARQPNASAVVFVSAYSSLGGMCKAVSWPNAPNGTDTRLTVQCFGAGLSLGDQRFNIFLIQ